MGLNRPKTIQARPNNPPPRQPAIRKKEQLASRRPPPPQSSDREAAIKSVAMVSVIAQVIKFNSHACFIFC